MKRVTIAIILLALLLFTCTYRSMSNFDKTDLAWMDAYEVGDTVFFESFDLIDTMMVTSKSVDNSHWPFMRNEGFAHYNAFAMYEYRILHKQHTLDGFFFIVKRQTLELNIRLDERFGFDIPLSSFVRLYVNGNLYKDCIKFDNKFSSLRDSISNTKNIKHLVWSKSKGLVEYSFDDGAVYEIKAKKHKNSKLL